MRLLLPLLLAVASLPVCGETAKPKVALEALQRLKGMDLENNPSLKAAVGKVIESARGTPDFIEIARTLDLRDVDGEVLEIALREGASSGPAVDGIRFLLANGNQELLGSRLATGHPAEVRTLADLLGHAGEPAAIGLLAALAADSGRDPELRNHAVRALARSEAGARSLIADIAADKLAADLRTTAATALRVAPWPAIQAEAAKHLPSSPGTPSLAELMAMKGDAARGAEVAALPQTACLACHRIGDEGVDFGPALTEIGNKLSREALFAAILDPAASISHGYQGWRISLKSGATRAGFIVSETDAEIGLKEPSGTVSRIPLDEIEERAALPGSLMPSGLERTMTTPQLVDLIEYLATLMP